MELPEVITPKELAEHWDCSERRLREIARRIGACRIIGRRLFFTPEDVKVIEEEIKYRPESPSASRRQGSNVRLPSNAYEKVVRMLEKDKQDKPKKKLPRRGITGK